MRRLPLLFLCGGVAGNFLCGSETDRLTALCGTATPPKGVCTVKGAVVLQPTWLKCEFVVEGQLVLESGANVTCANQTLRCAESTELCGVTTCEMHFAFSDGIRLNENAALVGSTLRLSSERGRVSIGTGAKVDASGLGLCGRDTISKTKPYSRRMGYGYDGAGHGGVGGTCAESPGTMPSDSHKGIYYGDATDVLHMWGHASLRPRDADALPLYGSGTALSPYIVGAKQQV